MDIYVAVPVAAKILPGIAAKGLHPDVVLRVVEAVVSESLTHAQRHAAKVCLDAPWTLSRSEGPSDNGWQVVLSVQRLELVSSRHPYTLVAG